MSANVGTIDRIVRLVAGLVLIALPFATAAESPLVLYGVPAAGVVLVLTSLFRFCPLYRLIGVRTCRV